MRKKEPIHLVITKSKVKAKPGIVFWKPKPPTGPDPIGVGQYLGTCGTPYNAQGARRKGWTTVEVLAFLKGRPLDEVVIAYVHSLRPSEVRITEGTITLDARVWRVTIITRKSGKRMLVWKIEQEVEILLPEGVVHGLALENAARFGLKSPQVKWHRDATMYIHSAKGFFKETNHGVVKWRFKKGNP